MPQQYDLRFQPCPRLECCEQDTEEKDQDRDHRGSAYLISPFTPARREFSVRTPILTRKFNQLLLRGY
jgi:hypothetical protein